MHHYTKVDASVYDGGGGIEPPAAGGLGQAGGAGAATAPPPGAVAGEGVDPTAGSEIQFSSYEWTGTFEGDVTVAVESLDMTVSAHVYAEATYDETVGWCKLDTPA